VHEIIDCNAQSSNNNKTTRRAIATAATKPLQQTLSSYWPTHKIKERVLVSYETIEAPAKAAKRAARTAATNKIASHF